MNRPFRLLLYSAAFFNVRYLIQLSAPRIAKHTDMIGIVWETIGFALAMAIFFAWNDRRIAKRNP
jgi:tryptophan-rich sensory protein